MPGDAWRRQVALWFAHRAAGMQGPCVLFASAGSAAIQSAADACTYRYGSIVGSGMCTGPCTGPQIVGAAAGAEGGCVPFACTALPAHMAARTPHTHACAPASRTAQSRPQPAPSHRFMLNFQMPDAALRAKLWRAAVPQQTPLAGGWPLVALWCLFAGAGGVERRGSP